MAEQFSTKPTADLDVEMNPAIDEDAPGPPISVPDAGEGGKVKMIIQLVKKCLGVKDVVAMRLSLPASLLDPIPNLEYWQYLDRPDLFAAINLSEDPFERMLAVLRFNFSKDLKFIKGRVTKPYNSTLGEHFRAHWDISVPRCSYPDTLATVTCSTPSISRPQGPLRSHSDVSSIASLPNSLQANGDVKARLSTLSLVDSRNGGDAEADADPNTLERVRVVFLTEQVSHHPPISSYYACCPARSVELKGVDQIAAKISGASLRVAPGPSNKGIFVSITGGPGEGETYQITHPVANVNGLLRGSYYVTVSESTIITCRGGKQGGAGRTQYRAVVEYKEESWLGKAHFLVDGVIHTYTEGETAHEEWFKVKHVPQDRVVAVFDGSWREQIRWRPVHTGLSSSASSPRTSAVVSATPSSISTLSLPAVPTKRLSLATASSASSSSSSASFASSTQLNRHKTLIDLNALEVVPKLVRPLEKQHERESRRLWDPVTARLQRKEFGDATKEKVRIEQRQRDEAAERKRKGVEFVPRYFERDISSGIPTLTTEGWNAVEEELAEDDSNGTGESL